MAEKSGSRRLPSIIAAVGGVLLLVAVFLGGLYVGARNSVEFQLGFPVPGTTTTTQDGTEIDPQDSTELAKRAAEVKRVLDGDALDPPTLDEATTGMINGLLRATGDTYSQYFDGMHYNYYLEESSGEFGGIGVVLSEYEGRAYVTEVYDGTPAATAGIMAGDFIIGVDGDVRDDWSADEVVRAVRGEPGKVLELAWRRPADRDDMGGERFSATVITAAITYPNVTMEMDGDVSVITITQFNEKTTQDVRAFIEQSIEDGATGFVLDLRNNPGGLLNKAIDMTSLFVSSGTVVQIDSRTSGSQRLSVDPELHMTDLPLVVLVNGDSASASEIVAAALQDHERALIVGEQSFGKGTVQTLQELSFGGGVKFTIAHYLSPDGYVIDKVGVTPDLVVPMDSALRGDEGSDTQRQAAVTAIGSIAAAGSLSIEGLSNPPGSQPHTPDVPAEDVTETPEASMPVVPEEEVTPAP